MIIYSCLLLNTTLSDRYKQTQHTLIYDNLYYIILYYKLELE